MALCLTTFSNILVIFCDLPHSSFLDIIICFSIFATVLSVDLEVNEVLTASYYLYTRVKSATWSAIYRNDINLIYTSINMPDNANG